MGGPPTTLGVYLSPFGRYTWEAGVSPHVKSMALSSKGHSEKYAKSLANPT